MNFYDNLEINEELENEFNWIKSLTFIDYHSGFNKLNIHDSFKKLFPNLSKIIFHSSFSNLTNAIYSIWKVSTNIIFDTTSPIFGDWSFIEIGNNNLAISNVNTKYLWAFRKKNEENFKIFSFEYAKVNFNSLSMIMTTKSDYSIIEENNWFCFNNIKMIYEFETNSHFTSSNSEILNLIDFINSHSFDLSTGGDGWIKPPIICKNCNLNMALSSTGIAATATLMIAGCKTWILTFSCFLVFCHEASASKWSEEQYSPSSPAWRDKFQDAFYGWLAAPKG